MEIATGAASTDHMLFGWRVRSAVPLPDLLPWTGDDRAPDVTIALGPVPAELPAPQFRGRFLQVGGDGAVRFAVDAVAAYLVDGDDRVTVAPAAGIAPDATDIRVFLYGSVMAILCYRRGLLPMHASAVELNGRAFLLCGESGAGKSTLAACLAGRGHRILADDIAALSLADPAVPMVLPAFPRLKIWRDAARILGLATEGLERSRPQLDKFHLPLARFDARPVPLAAIVQLVSVVAPQPETVTAYRGLEAMTRVRELAYRFRLASLLGWEEAMFAACARLAPAVRVLELARIPDLGRLERLAERVEALAS